MPRKLSSLLRSLIKSTPATPTTSASAAAAAKTSPAASTPKHNIVKSHKRPQPSKPPSPVLVSSLFEDTSSCSDSDSASNSIYLQRKAASYERKQQWIFKKGQVNYVNRLVDSCVAKLGIDTTLNVFLKSGRETSIEEFNALLKICIENASTTDDETVALEQVSKAFEVFMSMKEQGFPIEEESYGQVLLYLIDRGMVEQFHLFTDVIKDGNVSTRARLGYYEILLYTRVNDEEKVQEFYNCFFTSDGDETISLRENYLLALCDNDQKDYLLLLLETVDITQISSLDHTISIFQSLGRLSLESHAEKFLLELKKCDVEPEYISALVLNYVTSIPNETVVDVLLRFKNLHTGIERTPTFTVYAKLIEYCCDLLEVHEAFGLVDEMCKVGLSLSMDIIHILLNAVEKSSDLYLVQRIYSLICHYDLKPNVETFRQMISLSVKMKDFDGAYGMLNHLKKLNLTPTTSMYNAIIGGYFREKKSFNDVSKVLNQMKLAHVKPDSITYSHLINNCNSEEKVIEYYEELKASGVQVTKQFFMALIDAFASYGQFEKAKQVLSYEGIPDDHLTEIRSALVSALASHGEMDDALYIYDEMMVAGLNLEPKAAICLIEHLQHKGELGRVFQLLEELRDPLYFRDGCNRAIQCCIRNKHLRHAVDLLKRLKDRFCNDELAMEVLFDGVFSLIPDTEPVDLQIGMDLLQAIKDELSVSPSRKSLDFLLSACVKARDLRNSLSVWKEYQAAGLPYNVTNSLRMYQALLASQSFVSAEVTLQSIPRDDPHVCMLIEAYQGMYIRSKRTTGKAKGVQ